MADQNPLGTYTPDLIGKPWDAHGARETEEALRRLLGQLLNILEALRLAGISTDGIATGSAAATFYQRISQDNVQVEQREILDFTGPGVTVDDAGDRTVVSVVTPEEVASALDTQNDFILRQAIEHYAVRDILTKSYR